MQGWKMSGAALRINSGEMNIGQAAEYCGINPKTLYNRIADNQGPRHIKKFGRLIFLAGDLDAWINQNTVIKKAFGRR